MKVDRSSLLKYYTEAWLKADHLNFVSPLICIEEYGESDDLTMLKRKMWYLSTYIRFDEIDYES